MNFGELQFAFSRLAFLCYEGCCLVYFCWDQGQNIACVQYWWPRCPDIKRFIHVLHRAWFDMLLEGKCLSGLLFHSYSAHIRNSGAKSTPSESLVGSLKVVVDRLNAWWIPRITIFVPSSGFIILGIMTFVETSECFHDIVRTISRNHCGFSLSRSMKGSAWPSRLISWWGAWLHG